MSVHIPDIVSVNTAVLWSSFRDPFLLNEAVFPSEMSRPRTRLTDLNVKKNTF